MATPKLRLIKTQGSLVHFQALETEIQRRTADEINRARAFALFVLEDTFAVSSEHAHSHIVDGGNDRGIDFVFIDEENKIINIGSCKTVTQYTKSRKNFPGNEVDKLISIATDIAFHNEEILDFVNERLSYAIRRIWDALSAFNYSVVFHLFSNQLTLVPSDRSRLAESLLHHGFSLEEHGLYELAHGLVRRSRPNFVKQLRPCETCGYQELNAATRGVSTKVDLNEIVTFLVDADTGKLDQRLLAENVRYFLGTTNEVNSEIRQTLVDGRRSEFWFLNNGLTIVCDQIVGMPNGNHQLTLRNPQVVNGGQTAAVLVDVLGRSLISDFGGSVNVKIIETMDRDFIRRICTASNTQTRILNRDLRANDAVQIMIASALASEGYYYIRKRGEVASQNAGTPIDAQRLGQLILSYVQGSPVQCKTQSNEIFGDLYDFVFDASSLDASILVTAIRCYEDILKLRQREEARLLSIERPKLNESWLIEGHFHVLFALGELARTFGRDLANYDDIITYLDRALSIVGTYVSLHPRVSFYRLFRSASSKEDIQKLISDGSPPSLSNPLQIELFP